MKDRLSTTKEVQVKDMQSYYQFQAKIYDATRWTFLYGRNAILKKIPFERDAPLQILEVGCGTGTNLIKLAQMFPNATILGLDVSGDMLKVAETKLAPYKNRVTLIEKPYEKGTEYNGRFDVILFSYALTMINPQWTELVEQAPNDLKDKGVVAVVDFHDANFEFYRGFMRNNHVKLNGHILPVLEKSFDTKLSKVKPGFLNVWQYMLYVGGKKK
ncbi:MAG: class I SAM-dependent methyltransferase [Microscillaceae bacterium]|jgi:S-adenosylmethionine-diacylgycerolhomoserine-N-methlytransferase|nr:class I SAM-dependent methyltransferase [Microscillaceae bacterium]